MNCITQGNDSGIAPASGHWHVGRTHVYFKDSAALATESYVESNAWGFSNQTDTITDIMWATSLAGNWDGPSGDSCKLTFDIFTDEGSGTFEYAMGRDTNFSDAQDNQPDDFLVIFPGFPENDAVVDITNFRLYYRSSSASASIAGIDSVIMLGPSDSTGLDFTGTAAVTFDSVDVALAATGDGDEETITYDGRDFHSQYWQPALRIVTNIDAGEFVDLIRVACVYRKEVVR